MARKNRSPKKAASTEEDGRIVLATNRRARRNYVVNDRFEAGLVLLGSEVKSLRNETPTIAEGYARFLGEELWLQGVYIAPLPQASHMNHEPTRSRKLLLRKRELRRLLHQLEAKGQTLIPLQIYFKGPRVKVELGLARGRRKADKREYERAKEDRRRIREAT